MDFSHRFLDVEFDPTSLMERIAQRTSFDSATNLWYHFGQLTSVSPQTYRHVFRHRAAQQRHGASASGLRAG